MKTIKIKMSLEEDGLTTKDEGICLVVKESCSMKWPNTLRDGIWDKSKQLQVLLFNRDQHFWYDIKSYKDFLKGNLI